MLLQAGKRLMPKWMIGRSKYRELLSEGQCRHSQCVTRELVIVAARWESVLVVIIPAQYQPQYLDRDMGLAGAAAAIWRDRRI